LDEGLLDLELRIVELARQLDEARAQQNATADVLSVISNSKFDLDDVLTAVISSAIVLCEADRGVIWLLREGKYRLAAHTNYPDEWVAFAQDYVLEPAPDAVTGSGLAIYTGEVINIADLPNDPRFKSLTSHGLGDYHGGLAVPMKRDGQVIGVIALSRTAIGPFSDGQIALVQTFASQAIIAIENVRLFAELDRRNREILSRYFSPSLAHRLSDGMDDMELAGQRREVAVLFSDIEGFTSLAEALNPKLLGELLNGYLAGMTSVVFAHEGTVAKIVGDALHVLFGAPGDQPDHAARAVACALELDGFAEEFRQEWQTRGVVLGRTRIGVNAGPAIVGNFGGGRFFDYTAYGDTVNTAARLETANKHLGTRICISENVVTQVPAFRGRPIGDLLLRGRAETLRAYEPVLPSEGYLQAFALLETLNPSALGSFATEVGKNPDDGLAGLHLKRLLNGATGARIVLD
jgi:class 3 adenylate cyclase